MKNEKWNNTLENIKLKWKWKCAFLLLLFRLCFRLSIVLGGDFGAPFYMCIAWLKCEISEQSVVCVCVFIFCIWRSCINSLFECKFFLEAMLRVVENNNVTNFVLHEIVLFLLMSNFRSKLLKMNMHFYFNLYQGNFNLFCSNMVLVSTQMR